MRRWYQSNKAAHISYVRNRDGKIQEWFRAYKKTLVCEACAEKIIQLVWTFTILIRVKRSFQ
jgi:hypothetical protein